MEYFIKLTAIDLYSTFFCGQAFRWEDLGGGVFYGAAGARKIRVRQEKDGVTLIGVKKADVAFWESYFCSDEDYSALIEIFSADKTMREACAFAPGIRVLRQEPFETLITFIISQNNNIKRISGIIKTLCAVFGENNAFPAPKKLAALSGEDLSPLKAGYRADYILDAAKKIAFGEITLDEIDKMPYNEAKSKLKEIKGVGDKVADCVLLYGFHKLEAFPRDVWVKRAAAEYYPAGLPECIRGYEGVAQQFLFHYIRNKEK